MNKCTLLAAVAAMTLPSGPAFAQATTQTQTSQQNPIAAILGTLFGTPPGGATTSIEAQWAAGQTPLANQRLQFDSRIDNEVRTGTLTQATGARLKTDYFALVQLETQFGADRRFTTQERTILADRYGELTQVLADRGYADNATAATAVVADGRAEFDGRVNSAVTARRILRTEGTRLKADYTAVVQIEAGYLRDGVITDRERDDLDARLDALDVRLGDRGYAVAPPTARARLDAISGALPTSGLTRAAQAQLRVEHEDVSRLEAAYTRLSVTADERAYLERRLVDLETRARVR